MLHLYCSCNGRAIQMHYLLQRRVTHRPCQQKQQKDWPTTTNKVQGNLIHSPECKRESQTPLLYLGLWKWREKKHEAKTENQGFAGASIRAWAEVMGSYSCRVAGDTLFFLSPSVPFTSLITARGVDERVMGGLGVERSFPGAERFGLAEGWWWRNRTRSRRGRRGGVDNLNGEKDFGFEL